MKFRRPGRYVRENRQIIKGLENQAAAFIGVTEKGATDRAIPVTSFEEYRNIFGTITDEKGLTYAVSQFFQNGGSRLYIARVSRDDGSNPHNSDYQKAFSLLDNVKDISIVAVPGLGLPSLIGFGSFYCQQRGDCFFIGDMPSHIGTTAEALSIANQISPVISFGAVYLPWIMINDPTGKTSRLVAAPPSGAVAGIYFRTDENRGIWKAPAGKDGTVNEAVGLSFNITSRDQDSLNSSGINAIREFPGRGILVWGSRTLASQSDPEFKYVPVRRTAIFIEQSIRKGLEWVVFEPNNEPLRTNIRQTTESFMMDLFRKGALQGITPDEAFFVRCGRDTTALNEIDSGMLNLVIGFSLVKPAEFLILNIQLKTGKE
ncbi:MAG: phage tail sheath family protein [Chlorobi bacterium]|nr:phage tail sheath family protein [Chlorobiota bacterium]